MEAGIFVLTLMPTRFVPWIYLLFLLPQPILAQRAAVISKAGTEREVWYLAGDEIRFRLQGEDHYRRSTIQSVSDTGLVFQYFSIGFDEIEVVDLQGRRFAMFPFRSLGSVLLYGGVGFITIDWFNQKVVQGNDYEASEGLLIAGATAAVAGGTLLLFEPKKLRLGGKYRMRAIDRR